MKSPYFQSYPTLPYSILCSREERIKEQKKYGIFYDDEYDYMQHLKERQARLELVAVYQPKKEVHTCVAYMCMSRMYAMCVSCMCICPFVHTYRTKHMHMYETCTNMTCVRTYTMTHVCMFCGT